MEEVSRLGIDTVAFPQLGIELTVDKEAFVLFGLSIKWYGIMIALGLLLAMIYCFKRTKQFGIDGDKLIDVVFFGLIGAVIGARLYYVVLHRESFHDIRDVLAIRDGGLAVYGGIIGALLFGFVTAKIRKIRVLPSFDLAAMGFLIGQGIGRWGNFFNQEAFGTNTVLPWGMTGGRIQNYLLYMQESLAAQGMEVNPYLPVHPCFLYEFIWCMTGFVILHFYHTKRRFDGELLCMYAFWYGLGRFFIEGLRTDSLYIGSFRASQVLALVSAAAALAVIIAMRIVVKKKGMVLYRDTEESKTMLAELERAEKKEAEKKRAKKEKRQELSAEDKIISDNDENDI